MPDDLLVSIPIFRDADADQEHNAFRKFPKVDVTALLTALEICRRDCCYDDQQHTNNQNYRLEHNGTLNECDRKR